MSLGQEQQQHALALLNSLPWGDVDGAIRAFEHALRVALEATANDFQCWEERAFGQGFDDEFSLTSEQVESLSDQWRAAYVARLLRNMALLYGVRTEFGPGPLGEPQLSRDSIGGVVRALNDMAVPST